MKNLFITLTALIIVTSTISFTPVAQLEFIPRSTDVSSSRATTLPSRTVKVSPAEPLQGTSLQVQGSSPALQAPAITIQGSSPSLQTTYNPQQAL